jgi:RNA polymerase sigma-70 factor (ECF subfamily)
MQAPPGPSTDIPSPAVLRALVGNHRAFLAFLERRVGDRATAEDILQEAFVRGLGKLSDLRDDQSAIAWFYRSLRNAVIDHYRRSGSRSRAFEAFAVELEEAVEPDGETRGTICGCVGELAKTLKPEYAEAIARVEVDGLAVKDYAAEAGISGGNASVRLSRARDALRRQVARACGTCATHGCLDCTCGEPDRGSCGHSGPARGE